MQDGGKWRGDKSRVRTYQRGIQTRSRRHEGRWNLDPWQRAAVVLSRLIVNPSCTNTKTLIGYWTEHKYLNHIMRRSKPGLRICWKIDVLPGGPLICCWLIFFFALISCVITLNKNTTCTKTLKTSHVVAQLIFRVISQRTLIHALICVQYLGPDMAGPTII